MRFSWSVCHVRLEKWQCNQQRKERKSKYWRCTRERAQAASLLSPLPFYRARTLSLFSFRQICLCQHARWWLAFNPHFVINHRLFREIYHFFFLRASISHPKPGSYSFCLGLKRGKLISKHLRHPPWSCLELFFSLCVVQFCLPSISARSGQLLH